MQIRFKDTNFDLSYTMIMGIVELDAQKEFHAQEVTEQIEEYIESGANFIEFRVDGCDVAAEREAELLVKAISIAKVYKEKSGIRIAAQTSEPLNMQAAVEAQADMIIDPLALGKLGASEMIARLDVPVCLCFDKTRVFNREHDFDPISAVSEFFYERVDACLRAGINRQKLLLDPMLGASTSMEARLKMYGRINSLNSFGIPLTCEIPRAFPADPLISNREENAANAANAANTADASEHKDFDEERSNNLPVTVAVCLFAEKQGVRIIRTNQVYDVALALDTWQAMNMSARPFKLRNVFKRSFTELRNKRLKKRLSSIKGK